MDGFRIPLGEWAEAVVDFLGDAFGWLFDLIATVLKGVYGGLEWLLSAPPFWIIVVLTALSEFPQSCSSKFLRSRGNASAGLCRW